MNAKRIKLSAFPSEHYVFQMSLVVQAHTEKTANIAMLTPIKQIY